MLEYYTSQRCLISCYVIDSDHAVHGSIPYYKRLVYVNHTSLTIISEELTVYLLGRHASNLPLFKNYIEAKMFIVMDITSTYFEQGFQCCASAHILYILRGYKKATIYKRHSSSHARLQFQPAIRLCFVQ